MFWGAMANASTAMQAMSWDLGTISQNIANVNTTGYKDKQTAFTTMLSEQLSATPTGSGSNGTAVFGVAHYDRYAIDQQGSIQTTNVSTDLAISGKGFFIMAPPDIKTGAPPTTLTLGGKTTSALYTRDGGFVQKADDPANPVKSYFVNSSGDYLMGWMASTTPGAAAAPLAAGSLAPVYIMPTTQLAGSATAQGAIGANIPADVTATSGVQTVTASVVDNHGTAQTLSMTWTRLNATDWTVAATGVTGGGTVNNIATPPSPVYTVTLDGKGNIVNETSSQTGLPMNSFLIDWPGAPQTTTAAASLGSPTFTPNQATSLSVYDGTNALPHTLVMDFEKASNNNWYLRFDTQEGGLSTAAVTDAGGASQTLNLNWKNPTPGAAAGTTTWSVGAAGVTASGNGANTPATSDTASGGCTVTLDNTGQVTAVNGQAVPPASTQVPFIITGNGGSVSQMVDFSTSAPTFASVATAPVPVTFGGNGLLISPSSTTVNVTWANGLSNSINVDLSRLTQYAGTQIQESNISQDGYAPGMLTKTDFNTQGQMIGTYDNGQSHVLFQVPLALFPSDNSLSVVGNNMFAQSQGSGAPVVQAIGVGNSTQLMSGAVESSTVDIGSEFTTMILAQKAYSVNSQVFKIADEMTTTARDLHT